MLFGFSLVIRRVRARELDSTLFRVWARARLNCGRFWFCVLMVIVAEF